MSTTYRLPLRDKGHSRPFLPLATTTRGQFGMISKEGVLTHCRLVRPFKCSHTLESHNCPEEFIYGISWHEVFFFGSESYQSFLWEPQILSDGMNILSNFKFICEFSIVSSIASIVSLNCKKRKKVTIKFLLIMITFEVCQERNHSNFIPYFCGSRAGV